jgi:hypothetical protein
MPLGLHSFGAAAVGSDIYVAGGISSGRGEDFLKLTITVPPQMKLDGRQSLTLRLDVTDRNGDEPSVPVDVLIDARINAGTRPVLLSERTLTVTTTGFRATTLYPRGDDFLPNDPYSGTSPGSAASAETLPVGRIPPLQIDAIVRDEYFSGQTAEPAGFSSQRPDGHGSGQGGTRGRTRGESAAST